METLLEEQGRISDIREKSLGELKAKNDEEKLGESFRATDGSKILFQEIKKFNPSMHFGDKAYFLVKLPHIKPTYNKNGIKMGEIKAIDFFVITSDGESYRLDPFELLDKNYVLEEPDDIPDDRWSIESIRSYLTDFNNINVDPGVVFDSVREVWDYYIDFEGNTNADVIHTLYTILSYCYRLFDAIPYLLMQGQKGSAKSKVGAIHEQLDFNAFTTVAVTGPGLFRTIKDTGGTVIQDENEKMNVKEKSEGELDIEAITNSGYQTNGKTLRYELIGNKRKRVWYPTYCPKILCGINSVTETIRDRSFIFIMLKTLNSEKGNRPVSPSNPQWKAVRDNLMILVLKHWKEIKEIKDEGVSNNATIDNKKFEIRARDWEKAFPLLILAKFIDRYKNSDEVTSKVWEFLADQQRRMVEISLDSFDQVVIDSLERMILNALKDGKLTTDLNAIQLVDVASLIADKEGKNQDKKFNIRTYARSVKEKIIKLGIGKNFKAGEHNLTVFETNSDMIKSARERFNLKSPIENDKDASLINSISSFNFISLINSINQFLAQEVNQTNRGLIEHNVSEIRIVAEKLIKLIKLIDMQSEEKNNHFSETVESLKAKEITINEEISRIDLENSKELIYVLHPFRPDDIMRSLGFQFVNQSNNGVLYERVFKDNSGGQVTDKNLDKADGGI